MISRSLSREPNNLYVYEAQQNRGEGYCHFGRAKEFQLQIWRSALIKRAFISKAGNCGKYMKEANAFKKCIYSNILSCIFIKNF